MRREELRVMAARLLQDARAVRAAFPDVDAMRGVALGVRPTPPPDRDEAATSLGAAMKYVWDETALVRLGRADDLDVLDDEVAYAERVLGLL